MRLGDTGENLEGDPRFIRHTDNRHPGDVAVFRHALDQHFFHFCSLLDFGSRLPGQAGEHLQLHVVFFGHLHRTVVEHLSTQSSQFQHLVVSNFLQLEGSGNFPGVGSVHALHIRKDLAEVRVHGSRDSHRAGIGTAPSQGGDVLIPVDSLEARHHHNAPLIQRGTDAFRIYPLDPGSGIHGRGLEPGLPAQKGNHRESQFFNGHGQQGNGDLFPGGQQHIHLPLAALGIDFIGLFNQIVGGIPLRGHHHHDVVALLISVGDDPGDVKHPLGIRHRAASEFLYDQQNDPSFPAVTITAAACDAVMYWLTVFFRPKGGKIKQRQAAENRTAPEPPAYRSPAAAPASRSDRPVPAVQPRARRNPPPPGQ